MVFSVFVVIVYVSVVPAYGSKKSPCDTFKCFLFEASFFGRF